MKANKSTDPKRLNQLVDEGKVLLTPCKKLPGQRSTSYDDRMILDIAAGLDAVIISNDNYADLINQKPGKLNVKLIFVAANCFISVVVFQSGMY